MTNPDLALDFDGVLADTHAVALELIDGYDTEYSPEDIESWEWGIEEFGGRFLPALWHAWTIRPQDIEAVPDDIEQEVDMLSEYFNVDIVTAHPKHHDLESDDIIADGKRGWLFERVNDSLVDNFYVAEMAQTKADLGYDYYIDDNPNLPENLEDDQTCYLVDRPHNQNADGEFIRVNSITEAVRHYVIQDIRESVKEEVTQEIADKLI